MFDTICLCIPMSMQNEQEKGKGELGVWYGITWLSAITEAQV